MGEFQKTKLNEGQKLATDGFFKFLFNKEKELIISGPGGVGKTFLMAYLIDEIMPRYERTCQMMGINTQYDSVVMTALTNKAAEVLSQSIYKPVQTIHSFLNLKVHDDVKTGKSNLIQTNGWKIHQNKIIFIDEASMIDYELLCKINEGTQNCKIIYVGDHCQLAPVMEPISPIFKENFPFFELLEPMRNNEQPHLMNVCNQLRDTVETGVFHPIQIQPGVIDHLNDQQMEEEIFNHFIQDSKSKILAYSNNRVMSYNDHIRGIRQYNSTYAVGEKLINNNSILLKDSVISVEDEIEIIRLDRDTSFVEIETDVSLQIRFADLKTKYGEVLRSIPLPENKNHFSDLIKYYKRKKNWYHYFLLKKTYPDLRSRDAVTIHKSQGSTYDTVFIDLTDLSTCRNPIVVARLLYVAFTRAQSRVVLYGKLAEKYGGLTY